MRNSGSESGSNPGSESAPILVVAGILTDQDRRDHVLACQRHHTDPYGGQWEFPGGKVQSGESLQEALHRELEEELGIDAEIGQEMHRLRHRYPDRYVEVVFFAVRGFKGALRNNVFEDIRWVSRANLAGVPFLEADRDMIQRLSAGD